MVLVGCRISSGLFYNGGKGRKNRKKNAHGDAGGEVDGWRSPPCRCGVERREDVEDGEGVGHGEPEGVEGEEAAGADTGVGSGFDLFKLVRGWRKGIVRLTVAETEDELSGVVDAVARGFVQLVVVHAGACLHCLPVLLLALLLDLGEVPLGLNTSGLGKIFSSRIICLPKQK